MEGLTEIPVIYGVGPNGIMLVIRIMPSKEKAHEFLQKLGLQPISEKSPNQYSIQEVLDKDLTFVNKLWEAVQEESMSCPDCSNKSRYDRNYCAKHTEKMEEVKAIETLSDTLFTSYYGGCGDCDSVVVGSVPIDKPFVAWSFD